LLRCSKYRHCRAQLHRQVHWQETTICGGPVSETDTQQGLLMLNHTT
jgi:hypothetical protein